jgi:phosphohistidine phosphatase SixA
VALVGHEPELGQLAELCLDGASFDGRIELKKLGALCLAFEHRPAASHAQLLWLLPPRLLRAVR